MQMYDPPHPGETLKENLIEVGLTLPEAAAALDVAEPFLAAVIAEQAAISAELAVRLQMAGWGVAETWLRAQLGHDLWQARHRAAGFTVQPLAPQSSRARTEIIELAAAMLESDMLDQEGSERIAGTQNGHGPKL